MSEIGKPAKAALPAIETVIRDRDVPGLHHVVEAKYLIDGDAGYAIKHLVPLLDTEGGSELRRGEPGDRQNGAGREGRPSSVDSGNAEAQGKGDLLRPDRPR